MLKTFPQELTLVGRSTVLIKGIAARLGVKWSLADEWAPIARRLLERQSSANERRLGAPPKLRSVGRLERVGGWQGECDRPGAAHAGAPAARRGCGPCDQVQGSSQGEEGTSARLK